MEKSKSAIKAMEYRKNNQHLIRAYNNTPDRIKGLCISRWKNRYNIINNDFSSLYDLYKNTNFCNYCGVELTTTLYGNTKKCLDHNHVTGFVNGIICKSCNNRDVFNQQPLN